MATLLEGKQPVLSQAMAHAVMLKPNKHFKLHMKSTDLTKTKKPSSPNRWEAHCTEALYRLAGIRVVDYARRQACNAVLESQLVHHISAEMIGAFLAAAFKSQSFKKETGKPRRTPDFTPHRLFRSHHVAHIVQQQTDILISKPSILMTLGAELESNILADLTPPKIRQIICQGMDAYVPPPPRKRQPKNTVSPPSGTEKSAPQAPAASPPKIGGSPV